jgi:hypothetical protein
VSLLEIDMDETIDVSWVCRLWKSAETKNDWNNMNWQFQGAGMAIYAKDRQAGMDYWTLSDLALHIYLERLNDD